MPKLIPLSLTLDITNIKPYTSHSGSGMILLEGNIIKSSFLMEQQFRIPVLLIPMKEIEVGDRVRLTYFTTKDKIKQFPDGSMGCADMGIKYEQWDFDLNSWNLLYEDFT